MNQLNLKRMKKQKEFKRLHDQTTKHIERKKGREEEVIYHLKYIRN